MSELQIRVCSARVPATNCTCFAVVECAGVHVGHTKAKPGSSPIWNQSFVVPFSCEEITVLIKTRDRYGKINVEGTCTLPHHSTLKTQFADLWLDFGLGFPLQSCHVCMQIAPVTTTVVVQPSRKSLLRRMFSRTPSPNRQNQQQLVLVELYAELDEIRRIIYLAGGGRGENNDDAMMRSSELNTCLNELWKLKERVVNVGDTNVRNKLVELIEEYTRDCNVLLNDRAMRDLTEQVQSLSLRAVDAPYQQEEEEEEMVKEDKWKPHFISSLAAFDRLLDFGFVVECFHEGKRIERGGGETLDTVVRFSSAKVYVYDAATMRAYEFTDHCLDSFLQSGDTELCGLQLALKEIPHNTNLAVITITPELAFGAAPFDILPNSHLVIELVDVNTAETSPTKKD